MKNVHFIKNASNKTKVDSIQRVLSKLPASGFYFKPILCEQEDYRPLSICEIENALGQKTKNLFKKYGDHGGGKTIYAIEIQKGTNVKNVDNPLKLICAVSIIAENGSRVTMARNEVDLPNEIRNLVIGGMPLYDAYGKVFGEKIKNKEIPIYEYLTGIPESSWFKETVFKAFVC